MQPTRAHASLALAAGGLLGFVILASGVWHPKFPDGGLTQVGRTASLAFADGSILELGEADTELDLLRRHRMGGWQGHEYRQTFITSDDREIEVLDNRPGSSEASDDLDSGNNLLLAAYDQDADGKPPLVDRDGTGRASLLFDGRSRVVAGETAGGGGVFLEFIDGKDRLTAAASDAPVFALNSPEPFPATSLDLLLLGDPLGQWNNLQTVSNTGLLGFGAGGVAPGGGPTVNAPPIGTAVPEPFTLPLVGLAGVLVGVGLIWKRRVRPAA